MAGGRLLTESGDSIVTESGDPIVTEDFVAEESAQMVDAYTPMRRRVARLIRRWNTGAVTLTRSATVYALDARVDGVLAEYIDNETILETDLMLIASPKARLAGSVVDIVPDMRTDLIQVDGVTRVVKKVNAIPAASAAAMFHIVIAS